MPTLNLPVLLVLSGLCNTAQINIPLTRLSLTRKRSHCFCEQRLKCIRFIAYYMLPHHATHALVHGHFRLLRQSL